MPATPKTCQISLFEVKQSMDEWLFQRIHKKLVNDKFKPFVKPSNVSDNPEEVDRIKRRLVELESRGLTKRFSKDCWKLTEDNWQDYLDALSVKNSRARYILKND